MKKRSKLIIVSDDSSSIKEYKSSRFTVITFLAVALVSCAVVSYAFIDAYVYSKNTLYITELERENNALKKEVGIIDKKINNLKNIVSSISDLDKTFRKQNSIPPIGEEIRALGVGGNKVEYYLSDSIDDFDKKRLTGNKVSLDELERKLIFEKNSFKGLLTFIKKKEDSLLYLPSIMPIPEKSYKVTRAFGNNIFHPILKIKRPHNGIDIGCPKGTPIYAAANGIVLYAKRNSGYGKFVKLGHYPKGKNKNYGYITSYAHMSKIHVRKGQRIKRGDIIGEVGKTGLSTAPHLHYEVRYKGKPVKPDWYYFVNL